MTLWVLFSILTLVTLVWISWPLLRPKHAAGGRDAYDAVVYLDQLEELDRDRARGLVDDSQAEAARTEIERRLLTASRAESAAKPGVARPHIVLAALVLLGVPVATVPIYFELGSPYLPNLPFAERAPAAPTTNSVVAQAQARIKIAEQRANENPDDPEGWFDLGRFRLVSRDTDGAVEALARAMQASDNRADIASAYGEALARQADGRVTNEARNAFTIALASNTLDPRARYFLALSEYQEGRGEAALKAWSALGRSAPEGAPWLPAVQARIVETARELGEKPTDWLPPQLSSAPHRPFANGGPSSADVAAAQDMLPEDRQEMIRGMVANLAARLKDEPDDIEGWRRLARSREVLGETEASAQAYDKALELDPDHPETLLRSALSAEQVGKNTKARARFIRLRGLVAANSEVYQMVSEAIARLNETAGELSKTSTDMPPTQLPQTPRGRPPRSGPTGAEVAAAQDMSPEDRQEMIRGMVANLAARLEDEPDDVKGWRRLARSREVLGENQAAAKAYDKALELGPDHPETLLRAARSASQAGENTKARARFIRLRGLVPKDSEVHQMVSEAIAKLDEGGSPTDR